MIPAGVRCTIRGAIQARIDAVTLVIQTVVDTITTIVQAIVDPITPVVQAVFNAVTAVIKPVGNAIGFASHNSAGKQCDYCDKHTSFYCVHYVPCIHVSTP